MTHFTNLVGIPRDKTIYLMFSGGKGSALAGYVLKTYGYEDVALYFNDTKSEDRDLYRFLDETVEFLGYSLIRDSDGRNIWEVFKGERYMGNTRRDVCSRNLKRDMTRKYFSKKNKNSFVLASGIGVWEEHRHQRAKDIYKKTQGITLVAPLISAGVYDNDALFREFQMESGIEEPYLYKRGFTHNNCGGFCVKAGLAHYKNLLEVDRDRYLEFEEKEADVYQTIGNYPFLRKTVGGKLSYITLREYRMLLESPSYSPDDDDKYSTGSCNCALEVE
jgi:3'-phosphoadenosine 5'-phosphosulfate sulfotransferase (PAPS reductase)/FAD synthetase